MRDNTPGEEDIVRLTVFGATGRTGRPVVEQALAAGHEVVAFARTPAKLDIRHERLRIVQGDATDPAAVERAIDGADTVISAMKTTASQKVARTGPLTRGLQNIVVVMGSRRVRRLVTSAGGCAISDPEDMPDLRLKLTWGFGKLILPASMEDERGAARAVQASDLDWTIVRLAGPTNGTPTGRVQAGYAGRAMGLRITRADAAEFMLREAVERKYLRRAPLICSR
jgi:putative NADH-flavin reductase